MVRGLTVIIPAFRCTATIARSLAAVAQQSSDTPAGVRVIVAVNDGEAGSVAAAETHRTMIEARGYRFDVIETPPGRRAAFAAAEAIADPGARLFLDQDARLSPGALAAFARAAPDEGPPRFVTFSLRFARSRSPLVRAFLRSLARLPYFAASPVIAGAFGVSRAGRERWDTLPPVISDDKFVRLLFAPHERIRIASESYEVIAPDGYRELLRARARYARGNRELARYHRGAPPADAARHAGVASLLARPVSLCLLAVTTALAAVISRRA